MPVRNMFGSKEEFENALEDWFAGQALIGMAESNLTFKETAEASWELASEMMNIRLKLAR